MSQGGHPEEEDAGSDGGTQQDERVPCPHDLRGDAGPRCFLRLHQGACGACMLAFVCLYALSKFLASLGSRSISSFPPLVVFQCRGLGPTSGAPVVQLPRLTLRLPDPTLPPPPLSLFLTACAFTLKPSSQPQAVELTASQNLAQKRSGYLTAALTLSPNHEFRFMLVNQMQRDLSSSNMLEASAALTALCKLGGCSGILLVLIVVYGASVGVFFTDLCFCGSR